ncbi:two-component system regulatory protein YycI [Anaerosphaera multitolerans]|uniref:Regulatory protein YycH-like domain-containing protein n=1 Tax=Anaerosphaera multitolerans TaxID=2487351 RepID=A0A437S954_9FIRM|nr:two-component system regulatory protein YycI [Anaerosphaera multitolerans]RVU55650.1 hypothetical protein EF514_00085 [Anaerosphaera multitolerans]
MDWSKAKRILIVALLITNVILFGNLSFNYYYKRDKTTTNEFIDKTVELLGEKDIKIDAYIPKNKSNLPSLRVEFETYSASNINERFFDSLGTITEPSVDYNKISYGDELISIINSRTIRYENSSTRGDYNIENSTQAENLIKDFLIDHKFDFTNMQRTFVSEEDGRYYINYSKTYDDIVIERSHCRFVVDKSIGIISMDRLWLNVIDKSQSEIHLSSAPKALLTLLDDSENYGKTIVNIDECFYFDPEAQGYVEDITKATQGRAIPAWRIQFDDGESIEVDNY